MPTRKYTSLFAAGIMAPGGRFVLSSAGLFSFLGRSKGCSWVCGFWGFPWLCLRLVPAGLDPTSRDSGTKFTLLVLLAVLVPISPSFSLFPASLVLPLLAGRWCRVPWLFSGVRVVAEEATFTGWSVPRPFLAVADDITGAG